jgi:hypothetical protein
MPIKKTSLPSSIDHEVALLGISALAATPFVKRRGPEFDAAIEAGCKKRLVAAGKPGGLIDVIYQRGKIAAILTIHKDREAMPGITFPKLNIDCRHNDDGYKAAKTLIRRNLRHFSKDTICYTVSSRPRLRTLLTQAGFGIDSVVLDGPVGEGLARLVAKIDPPKNLKHLGLKIQKIKTRAEIDSVLKIFKREFTRNPQFGSWVGTAPYLRAIRANMRRALEKRKLDGYLICNDDGIWGYFGFYVIPENPLFPAGAGIEIILDQQIQGKGIAKTCYRMMLEKLNRRKIVLIRGGTSQPAVMALGKIMKRKPFIFLMRYQSKYFDADYFDSYR